MRMSCPQYLTATLVQEQNQTCTEDECHTTDPENCMCHERGEVSAPPIRSKESTISKLSSIVNIWQLKSHQTPAILNLHRDNGSHKLNRSCLKILHFPFSGQGNLCLGVHKQNFTLLWPPLCFPYKPHFFFSSATPEISTITPEPHQYPTLSASCALHLRPSTDVTLLVV